MPQRGIMCGVVMALGCMVTVGLSAPAVTSTLGTNSTPLDLPLMHTTYAYAAYAMMQVGTPPQTIAVLMDTGSATLAMSGSLSTGPGKLPACTSDADYKKGGCSIGSYTESSSQSSAIVPASGPINVDGLPSGTFTSVRGKPSTVTNNTCGTPTGATCGGAEAYGSATDNTGYQGDWIVDTITFANLSAPVPFVSMQEVLYEMEEAPVAGIFGVGNKRADCLHGTIKTVVSGSPDTTCVTNPMRLLLQHNGFERDAFAFCLSEPGKTGVLSLGGPNPNYYSGDINWVNLTTADQSDYYTVNFTAMYVGGQTACASLEACSGPPQEAKSPSGAIVDTGTPNLALASEAYLGLVHIVSGTQCASDADCLLEMQLEGPEPVCVQPSGFFQCNPSNHRCELTNTALGADLIAQESTTTFGYAFLKEVYTIFDRGTTASVLSDMSPGRIGLANRSGDCATPCSSFLSQYPCEVSAKCTWTAGTGCSGTQDPSSINNLGTGRVYGGLCSSALKH
eukprot:m.110137 g.110137  ORF g.110137 m.110137 type:complete len:508 (+) comp10707_c2_seq1:251-1774(+)